MIRTSKPVGFPNFKHSFNSTDQSVKPTEILQFLQHFYAPKIAWCQKDIREKLKTTKYLRSFIHLIHPNNPKEKRTNWGKKSKGKTYFDFQVQKLMTF